MQSNRGIFLRWITLFAFAAVITSAVYRKQDFFAGNLFAGWLIANFSLLAYSFYILTPGQKKLRFHNGLSLLVLLTFLLQALFLVNTSHGFILVPLNLLIVIFLIGLLSIKTAAVLVSEKGQPSVILLPFIFNTCWIVFVIIEQFIV
jgi:hypothetical protein